MKLKRSSGILLHITSLPSPYGIGDLGPEAYKFVDFLKDSGNSYWQLLPLNPTYDAYNHSPYSSDSAFAGNPILISPELLKKEGYVDRNDLLFPTGISEKKVNYREVGAYKEALINTAYENFKRSGKGLAAFKDFCKKHSTWINNYSLYKALHKKFKEPWVNWPKELRDRNLQALNKAEEELAASIEKIKFTQYLFFSQWKKLRDYGRSKEVKFFGDIPFYVNHDSADCWAYSQYFKLDDQKKPTKLSGVPPDYFSETGQLWGTPVYDWKILKKNSYDWWVNRIKQNLLLFDLVRLDHFRAFAAYWEVPAGEETAVNGKWVKTPGSDFFKILKKDFPNMPLIAEDLGSLDEPVYDLLEKFNFPGMNVLHFAFGEERVNNPYLPFNHIPDSLVYTGTHDNNTTRGWFKNEKEETRKHLNEFAGKNVTTGNVHFILHKIALGSVSKLAIIPLQDLLGLGEEGIMNTPGSTSGNWTWRVTPGQIPVERTKELKELNILFGRFHQENGRKKK